jgi:hypothetical protein
MVVLSPEVNLGVPETMWRGKVTRVVMDGTALP